MPRSRTNAIRVDAPPEIFETGEWCMRYIVFWALPLATLTSEHTWQLAVAQQHTEFTTLRYVLLNYTNRKIKFQAAPPEVPTEAVAAFCLIQRETWDVSPSGECYKVEFRDRDLVEMMRKNQGYVFKHGGGWQRNWSRLLVRKKVLHRKEMDVFDVMTRTRWEAFNVPLGGGLLPPGARPYERQMSRTHFGNWRTDGTSQM